MKEIIQIKAWFQVSGFVGSRYFHVRINNSRIQSQVLNHAIDAVIVFIHGNEACELCLAICHMITADLFVFKDICCTMKWNYSSVCK